MSHHDPFEVLETHFYGDGCPEHECPEVVAVWGDVEPFNPWPFCKNCGRRVYRVLDEAEWRHWR